MRIASYVIATALLTAACSAPIQSSAPPPAMSGTASTTNPAIIGGDPIDRFAYQVDIRRGVPESEH